MDYYTSGSWMVKPGKEGEFIKVWGSFANWCRQNKLGNTATLIQDLDNPSHFISFRDWPSQEAIDQWRKLPEFKSFFEQIKPLLESVKPMTLKRVFTTGE
jgi:quinol monooxygenase YgiN